MSFSRAGSAGARTAQQIARQFADTFKSTLMPCVIRWCDGAPFSEICAMLGNTFEGSIIRSMRRLSELAVQVLAAAKVMGNSELVDKLEQGIKAMHRDIIFAASLYL
jgi:ATP-dependent RNA helicase DOB1